VITDRLIIAGNVLFYFTFSSIPSKHVRCSGIFVIVGFSVWFQFFSLLFYNLCDFVLCFSGCHCQAPMKPHILTMITLVLLCLYSYWTRKLLDVLLKY